VNVLSIDTYSNPQTFEHYKTTYEACMNEGSRPDTVFESFVLKTISKRGVDATLCI